MVTSNFFRHGRACACGSVRGDFQRGAEKFLPLCVRVRRDSDFLDDKIGIDRSAAVMDTPIVRLNFLSLTRGRSTCFFLAINQGAGATAMSSF